MTQTELKLRQVQYLKEKSNSPPPEWIQVLINRTYKIVSESNLSCSDDPPRETL